MLRVLLIESDAQLARLLSWVLDEEGFQTNCVDNGTAAASAVTRIEPHAIVVDSDDIGLSELTALNQVTRSAGVPMLQIGRNSGRQESPALADAYLAKPFSADDLVRCLRELIDRN